MTRLFKGLALLAALALPVTAAANGPGFRNVLPFNVLASDGTTFSAEDLTTPAQTAVFDIRGVAWVTIYHNVAAVSGTANVTTDCYVGPTSADAAYHVQSEVVLAGASTHSDYIPSKSVSTAKKYPVTFNVANHSYMYCTFTATSGTINITIKGGH